MDTAMLLLGACEQSRAIARGELTAQALLDAQYAEIAQRDVHIRSYIAVAPPPHSNALSASPPSLLAGTSFAVKDNFDVEGLPTASGLRALSQSAQRDAVVVSRLRQAGMHCLGKLNMHPMALGASNHNPDYGDCIHPEHPGYSAGGSSGGSAAAVAAGLCGIALGTDTMGSVRLPAAYCGVVGFKPSHESLGLDGVVPLCRLLDHAGLVARRVEDVQAAMHIMAPHLPLAGSRQHPWRIGVVRNSQELGAEPAVLTAYADGLTQLIGHSNIECVDVILNSIDPGGVRRAGLLLCEAELHPLLEDLVQNRPETLPPDLLQMMRYIQRKSALDLGQAVKRVAQAGEDLESLTQGFDALVLPTAPQTTFLMTSQVPANQADLTALANMSGAPAISIPLPIGKGNFPVGLQLIGHRGHDHALLELASHIENLLDRS